MRANITLSLEVDLIREAKVLAARRGHRVTLFEQETELGGQIHAAAAPPHKAELLNAISNRVPLLKKYGVDLRLQTGVTADLVRQENPDVVILATGALPQRPPIPGIDLGHVYTLRDAHDARPDAARRRDPERLPPRGSAGFREVDRHLRPSSGQRRRVRRRVRVADAHRGSVSSGTGVLIHSPLSS